MRIKREIKIIINCIITIGITIAFLANSTNLFERKSSDFKYKPFFDQEEDFDVLFMGTSRL